MFKNKMWLGITLSIILLIFSINGFTAYYKYTQESGTNFYVGTDDKADALEDTNEMRQILDDLGFLLGHSLRNNLYPKDESTGGYLGRLNYGIDDSRPVTPVANDMYLATDTTKIYKCFVAGNWVQVYPEGGASTFLELTDTPETYDNGKYARSTADGVVWDDPAGAGDMLKTTYDTDTDDIVDKAETVDDGIGNSSIAADVKDAVTKKHTQNTDTAAGGEWDFGAHSAGFTIQTAGGDGETLIDWTAGNKFKFTFGAQNETITFTDPSNPCTLMLTLIQDGTGGRTVTWPATVKWAGGTAPTLTTTSNARDKVALDWDGVQYDAMASLDFK